jgi:hypothetical protein
MRVPPDPMDNIHKAIAAFWIPKSYLERNMQVYLVAKDETKATVHAMPDIVTGFTDVLDTKMKNCLFS